MHNMNREGFVGSKEENHKVLSGGEGQDYVGRSCVRRRGIEIRGVDDPNRAD